MMTFGEFEKLPDPPSGHLEPHHHGCIEFWVVDAKHKIIMVTTADRRTITYDQYANVPVPFAETAIPVASVFDF